MRHLLIAFVIVVLSFTWCTALEPPPSPRSDTSANESRLAEPLKGHVNHMQHRVFRSIHKVCRSDILHLCQEKTKALSCLSSKLGEIADSACKAWVQARLACFADVRAKGLCAPKEMPQMCLRKANVTALSAECADTDYYRSLRPFAGTVVRHSKS